MSSNLIVPVPRAAVNEQIKTLNYHISVANNVSSTSTFAHISMAERNLNMAKGLCNALRQFKMLSNWGPVEEDIRRIENKIDDIRTEKNRNYRPEKRRS